MNANYPRAGGPDVIAIKASDGSKAGFVVGAAGAGLTGNSLTAATWYFPIAESRESLSFVHMKWDSSFVGVITFESCGFPEFATALADANDVTLIDANTGAGLGNWVGENPTTVYVAFASATGASAGTGATSMTVTITGGTANGCTLHLGNNGGVRMRAKNVCSTAGIFRFVSWGKVT